MNDIYKIAIVIARIARSYIEVQGMKAENKQRELDGSLLLAYSEEHFYHLINENKLNNDDIKELFDMS